MMRYFTALGPMVCFGMAAILALAEPAQAQSLKGGAPQLDFCDPLMADVTDREDDGDDEEQDETVRLYDKERVEVLTDEADVMAALYEEAWNLETGAPVIRNELCRSEPSYVVNWTQLAVTGADGAPEVLAEGLMSLRRDGSFRFMYSKRPYEGTWAFADGQMTLTADWLNGGTPLVAPVERVVTPVEIRGSDGGDPLAYDEEIYRIGWFHSTPIPTTVKGQLQSCACFQE